MKIASVKTTNKKNQFKNNITVLVIAIILVGGLFILVKKVDKDKAAKVVEIRKHPLYLKGVITKLSSFKGHSVRINFVVNGTTYEYDGGWDKNPNDLDKGDSVWLKCSVDNPELAISELEKDY
ncbi:hypothetical protein [Mucilaginibacter sp. OK283]|jgi:hypothetical protein|uniref:hypothetical protein n=1 Tax=Mucilaginibacter sp. OK283 TaxID=1881049 RepID=UPI0008B99787|nr:hypothetical protein [Mucilaginibacter sp. OK283]SEP45990.1 hypothetical protein SAMN05428947_12431 [Mucilaginibacter sp. OK283]